AGDRSGPRSSSRPNAPAQPRPPFIAIISAGQHQHAPARRPATAAPARASPTRPTSSRSWRSPCGGTHWRSCSSGCSSRLCLAVRTAVFEPALGIVKRRIGARLGSSATAGEGTQNLLCAYLAIAVFAGLAANTLLGAWWLDGAVTLGIAAWAVVEGRRAWVGRSCGCASPPGTYC